jgi:hypothetical protein
MRSLSNTNLKFQHKYSRTNAREHHEIDYKYDLTQAEMLSQVYEEGKTKENLKD